MEQDREALLSQQISEFATAISGYGINLQIGTDFNEFLEIPSRQSLRHPINPMFDPNQSEISRSNGFWLLARDKSGEIVHTQAMKLLDLTQTNLEEYLKTQSWDLRSHGYDFDDSKTICKLTESSSKITGRITYHGELWIKGGPNGFRGGSLSILLTRLMILLAMLRWKPDFMIGLQSPMTAFKGLAAREGYTHMDQRSIQWFQRNSNVMMEDWLIWMNYSEAEFNLRIPPNYLFKLFEPMGSHNNEIREVKLKSA